MTEIVPTYNSRGEYVADVDRVHAMRPEETGLYCQAGQLFLVRMAEGTPLYAVAIRNRAKKYWPGALDFTASGMSDPGETELVTTIRETSEELGLVLDPADLREVGAWIPADGYSSRARVYVVLWSEKSVIPFNTADIEKIIWMTPDELSEAACAEMPMKPDLRTYILSGMWPPRFCEI